MLRFFQTAFLCLLLVVGLNSASGFSLLGPFAQDFSGSVWQVPRIGYALGGDLGGPMNLGEEYRWNIKTVTYGFDSTFIAYFGQRGIDEVDKAVKILNSLPPVSRMSADLHEFPTDTRRYNQQAAALNLIDLRSAALGILLEEMGLAAPERYVWCLRSRVVLPNNAGTNYSVIMRNFDPVTTEPTRYVNGTLYTYTVVEPAGPDISDAIETPVDPLAPSFTAVAGYSELGLIYGQYYTGLTRDDVGGLRYVYRKKNINPENLLPDTVPGARNSPWTPVGSGTNAVSTNLLVNTALRPGVEKIVFKKMKNWAKIGPIIAKTNHYTDVYLDGRGRLRKQKTQRALVDPADPSGATGMPDILFSAADLGINAAGYLPLYLRTDTTSWENNAGLNTQSPFGAAGPGVIQPSINITFNNVGPFNFNHFVGFMDEANIAETGWVWGSFDGTTNAPIVYPSQKSIQQIEDQILGGAF